MRRPPGRGLVAPDERQQPGEIPRRGAADGSLVVSGEGGEEVTAAAVQRRRTQVERGERLAQCGFAAERVEEGIGRRDVRHGEREGREVAQRDLDRVGEHRQAR